MKLDFETIQSIDLWIKQSVTGCNLIGVSEDGELFLEYQDPTEELEIAVETKIREKFPQINRFITVTKPSIRQLEEAVKELNKLLTGEPKKPDLLQIEL